MAILNGGYNGDDNEGNLPDGESFEDFDKNLSVLPIVNPDRHYDDATEQVYGSGLAGLQNEIGGTIPSLALPDDPEIHES